MSDRSKNIIATAALIGMAAIASSGNLIAPAAPSAPAAQAAQLQPAPTGSVEVASNGR